MTPLDENGRANTGGVDESTLARALRASGLLDRDLSAQAAALGAQFPRAVGRDLFLEYELTPRPVVAGLGFGFQAGALDLAMAIDAPFLRRPAGRKVAAALAEDPFAADHAIHLNLGGDPDPDWVEYDIDGGRIAAEPFVFFRPPERFATLAGSEDVKAFCAAAPGQPPDGDLVRLLGALARSAPVGLYRVGVARRRGAEWLRVIVSRLSQDQVASALTDASAAGFAAVLAASRRFYAAMDAPGSCYALSVDVNAGRVTAMDVECPYLFRIEDPRARAAPFAALAADLAADGLVAPEAEAWLAANVRRDVRPPAGPEVLRITLHHLKHRFLGAPHGRTKAYLHLGLMDVTEAAW